MNAALTTKGSRATKGDLTVEIYDKIGRANLFLHAKGGTRRAKGGNLSIPSSVNVQRTSGGAVRTQQQPKNLRNSFKRGRFIFQRQGRSTRKAKGRIKLMCKRRSRPIRKGLAWGLQSVDQRVCKSLAGGMEAATTENYEVRPNDQGRSSSIRDCG
ncbi:hypothetical protein [Bradyrhizobium diazoefficiens]